MIGGARTPFVEAGTVFKTYTALQLAAHSVTGLLEKLKLDPRSVDELVYGMVVVDPRISPLSREVVFASQLPTEWISCTGFSTNSLSGTITAGNSSPLTDGAASVLLMSEERARKEGREPLAFIRALEFVDINPKDGLLMGPGVAPNFI